MGSLLKTSVLVGFLLLLPALVYCDRFVKIDLFEDTNCTQVPTQNYFATSISFNSTSNDPNTTIVPYKLNNVTTTFSSAILTDVAGQVLSLFGCQFGLECNATGAILIDFNLDDIGACSTAGPPGTLFDKFLIN